MKLEDKKKLQKKAISRGISTNGESGYLRHVLYCGQSGCCNHKDEAKATRKVLNKGLKALKEEGIAVYMSEVECLRFCQSGPLLVVYPEGVWYGRVSPEVCGRIIDEHLRDGRIVDEHVFARNPLVNIEIGDEK